MSKIQYQIARDIAFRMDLEAENMDSESRDQEMSRNIKQKFASSSNGS